MTQNIFGLGLGATGIVGVLIIAGIFIKTFGDQSLGDLAMWAGVAIGITLGVLGIFGVLITLSKRL